MPLVIQPIGEEDLQEYTRLSTKVFAPEPVSRAVFPSGSTPENEVVDLKNAVSQLNHERGFRLLCVRDTDMTHALNPPSGARSGEMIAVAKWRLEDEETYDGGGQASEHPPHSNPDAMARFHGGMSRLRKDIMGRQRYWHLVILTTDPQHGRRGAATMLLKWGLEHADQDGLPAYVSSSEKGFALYKRFGFDAKRTDEIDLRPYRVEATRVTTAMVRPASRTTQSKLSATS